MSKKNQVVHVSDMIPYILSGQLKFSHRMKNNESILYSNLKSLAIHPAMYCISFDKNCELECISEETGMTCLMLALDLYNHPSVKKDRGYQNQVLSIVQQIFFRYEKNIEHKDKKGKNLLYYFIKKIDHPSDKNMVGFLIQHLLFEYFEKEIPIDWDIEDDEGSSIRYLFLRYNWNQYVHLTPPLKESFDQMDMKKQCNFKIMDMMRDKQEILEKCIQLINDDPEIETYELIDEHSNSILQCMVLMMNKEDEKFVIQLLDHPKLFYFKYDLENPKHHIINIAIANQYYSFAVEFLKKMRERNDWNEFRSILLDPEVEFYSHFSEQIKGIDVNMNKAEDAYSIIELLEFVYQNDKHKKTIYPVHSKSLLHICMLKQNDIPYVDFQLFQRIMNYEELRDEKKLYPINDDMIEFISYMINSLKMEQYQEEDLIQAFDRLLPYLELKNMYKLFQCIHENDLVMKMVFENKKVKRHVSSILGQYQKEEFFCVMKEEDSCTICLESLKDKYYTCIKCNQSTHITCLSSWIKENSTCVTCRTNIGKEEKKRLNSLEKYIFYQHINAKYMTK